MTGRPNPPTPHRYPPQAAWILLAFFVLALAPRLYGGLSFGTDLDGDGTFSMVNFDEGGSCRAVVGSTRYPAFLGHQIVAIATALGHGPPRLAFGAQRAKAYCQSRPLIMLQRGFSAVTGALTVVLVGVIGLMLWPDRPRVAWTASALLALSNFHVAQSHWGTADAPQVFFIYLLVALLSYGVVSGRLWPLLASPLLLTAAIWAKWYLFAGFAYAGIVPHLNLRRRWPAYAGGVVGLGLATLAVFGWDDVSELWNRYRYLIWGQETSPFGTGYAQIGTWRRWIRNAVNLPVVHIVGLGLPACLFFLPGLKRALVDRERRLLWLVHSPALVYAAYLLALAPVTYYRHYLPLFPTVVLLIAQGFWASRWSSRRVFLVLFFLYPALLTVDSELDYRLDPRRELRDWYQQHSDPRVLMTYYVVPPRTTRGARLIDMQRYIDAPDRVLSSIDYVILSENWYDTSFANELNGPIAWDPEWLVKTRPEHVRAYRRILSGEDPKLELDAELDIVDFTPEFLAHSFFYGTFQLFVGDLKVYRVVRDRG